MKFIFIAMLVMLPLAACACAVETEYEAVEVVEVTEAEADDIVENGGFPFEFSTPDVNGDVVTQDDLPLREFYFVYLWATWCGPCVAALPLLGELYEEFGDRVGFLGLMVDFDTDGAAAGLVNDAGATFSHVSRTANGELADVLNTGFVPSAGLFNADGTLVGGELIRGARHYRLFIEAALGI
ncbi:MAG: TlpA family protein disulfide reductase [Defluviitaleaceae bacterium]|nr:TlpA family protein disulfide reductase [Defluviitaleaceae bacterium]